ncbi:IS1595 family transposase [Psychromicrobium lacuslunae]|uniref:IS1595 family transposase n=1 Tax=Psychromicrobium lacuslunae TaxID=1618207 RepID=UPI0009E40DC5|nr:IS1595 family transposase [Psychromicrobium lacuslunae]
MGSAGDDVVAGVDYPADFGQFQDWFSTDEACFEYLAHLRWPDGFACPRCAGLDAWATASGLWMCRNCGRRTSVTSGTLFDRTRTPLRTWFAAVWFVTAQKNGVSALGLQRVLGLRSYETAWAWMHKLRRAMVMPERELLGGTVEVDESYIGGISRGKTGRSTDKVPVMSAAENLGRNRIGRIRMEPTTPESLPLVKFAQRVIVAGSVIKTDGAQELRRLGNLGFQHKFYTQLGSSTPAHIDLPAVHMVASQLKRWMLGTMHYGASSDHFGYYLDEFTFRFNRRAANSRGLLFYRLLHQAVRTEPRPLNELVSSENNKYLK